MTKNLTIKTSLTLVISIFVAMMIAVSALGLVSLASSNTSLQEVYTIDTPALVELKGSSEQIMRLRQALATYASYLNLGDMDGANAALKRGASYLKASNELFAAYSNRSKAGQREADLFRRVTEKRQALLAQAIEPQEAALKAGNIIIFHDLQARKAPGLYADYDKAIRELEELQLAHEKERYDTAQTRFRFMMAAFGTAVAAALAIGIFARTALVRAIVKPVDAAVALFDKIAAGDLTTAIATGGKNEMGRLLAALKRMQSELSRTVGVVRGSTEAINTGAKEIAQGNTDLSQRTEEQASSLEETAASMEQLTAAVKNNADNATQATQLAVSASQTAAQGGDVVQQVVETMQGIAHSSHQITDILSVIDGIAFQTNILALNAAVEAARAGEQGRGFAVVAGEVRTLAQRSAGAAKEIKALIEESSRRVEAGSALVNQAGQTMQDIMQSVKRVTDIMGEISAASVEQSRGIEQVNRAITQMDEVTQHNAALVEEAAAAATALEEQALRLREAVAVFSMESGSTPATAAPARPARQEPALSLAA